jgi:hypothetical protein
MYTCLYVIRRYTTCVHAYLYIILSLSLDIAHIAHNPNHIIQTDKAHAPRNTLIQTFIMLIMRACMVNLTYKLLLHLFTRSGAY